MNDEATDQPTVEEGVREFIAHFVIEGAYLVERARDMMLSERPSQAWRVLSEGLIGDGNTQELAMQILDGKKTLTGDSQVGIGVADEDPEKVAKYLEDLRYIYAGRVHYAGRHWRPRAEVTNFGPDDASFANTMNYRNTSMARVACYAGPDEVVLNCFQAKRKRPPVTKREREEYYIIFEPCGAPPFWWPETTDPSKALDDAIGAGRCLEEESWTRRFKPQHDAEARALSPAKPRAKTKEERER
jgi:hypothetical protein